MHLPPLEVPGASAQQDLACWGIELRNHVAWLRHLRPSPLLPRRWFRETPSLMLGPHLGQSDQDPFARHLEQARL
jgi:hypothetical protein